MPTLAFDVLYKDHGADKGLRQLGQTTEKTGHSFRALKVAGAAALLAVGVAAVKFGSQSVKAYVEAEGSQIRLQEASRKFPKLADTNIGSLNKLNSALALKTKYDDDATASGQAVLAQFNLTGKQITQLTPLLQDYAAKTGKDLPTAARDLGKAVMGQGRSLKAVGIDFKDTGTQAGNLDQITKGLRTQVGGFADKEGKSAAGQSAILRNQFGELQEAAGKQLLPALLKVGGGLLRLVGWVQSLSPLFSSFKKIASATFGAFSDSVGLGGLSFKRFADFIESHQGDIVGAFVKIGTFAIRYGIVQAKVLSAVLRGFGGFSDGVGHVVSFIIDRFGEIVHSAAIAFGWIPGIGPKLTTLDGKFTAFADHARDGITKTGDKARGFADGIDNKLVPSLKAAGRTMDEVGKKEIVKAEVRDAVKRAALAVEDLGTKSNGSQIKLKKWADVSKLSADTQKGLNDRLKGVKGALVEQLTAMRDAGAGQGKLTAAWKLGKERLYDEFRQMGLSKTEARKLAEQYGKVPAKVRTVVTQPGMNDANRDTLTLRTRIKNLDGKTVRITYATNAAGLAKTFKVTLKQTHDTFTPKARGGIVGMAKGGILPGFTPLSRGDDIMFPMARGGIQPLRGGEGITVPEALRDPFERARLHAINRAALSGQPLRRLQGQEPGRAQGGVIDRNIRIPVSGGPSYPDFNTISNRLASNVGGAVGSAIWRSVNRQIAAKIAAAKRAAAKAAAAAAAGGGGDPGGPAVGGGRNRVNWKGGTFTERFRNTLIRAQRIGGIGIPVFQGGFSHRVAISGTSHYGDAIDTAWSPGRLSEMRRARIAAWHRTPAQGFIHHIHGVPLPGAGFPGGSGVWQAQDYLRGGNGLAAGAVVKGGRGGVTTRIGEGRRDELVAPLPRNWENLVRVMERGGGGGGITVVINAPNYVGTPKQLMDALPPALAALDRQGRLTAIKSR